MIALLSAVALAASPVPDQRIMTEVQEAEQRAQFEHAQDNAWRKFWIAQGLAAADIALTCAILSDGGRELNPIYGNNADCGRIVAIRGGVAVLQYFLARKAIEDNPRRAGKALNITLAVQGFPVLWNIVQLAR